MDLKEEKAQIIDEAENQASIYYLSARIKHCVCESINGCGWGPSYEGWGSEFASNRKLVEVLREMVEESGGQDLAQYCYDVRVKQIDIVVQNSDLMEFYVTFDNPPSAQELEAFHSEFIGQLSDGWGEGFEQIDSNLRYTETRPSEDNDSEEDEEDEVDCGLWFSVDYKTLTRPVPYDPVKMLSLKDIEEITARDSTESKKTIRP